MLRDRRIDFWPSDLALRDRVRALLEAAGYGTEISSCPDCGRTEFHVTAEVPASCLSRAWQGRGVRVVRGAGGTVRVKVSIVPDWTETWLRAVCPAPAPCYLLRLERDYVGLNADDPAGAFLEVGGLIPAGLRAAVPRWVPVYFGACTII